MKKKVVVLIVVSLVVVISILNLRPKLISTANGEDVEMMLVTDIHYISDGINDHGIAFSEMVDSVDGRQVNYIEQLTEALVYETNMTKPEVLIVSGDLTHNGEKVSHQDLAKKFAKIEESGTEVLVIPGNHDINNPYAREFKGDEQVETSSITEKQFASIYSDFGYNQAYMRDSDSLSYLATPSKDLWVLMIDTSKYDINFTYPVTNGEISEKTLAWIEECTTLAAENDAEIITVMHHNLYDHSELLNRGYTLDNNEEVLDVFKQLDLSVVFSGHVHIQDIAYDEKYGVYDIVTSGFVIYPIQYGIINYLDGTISYQTRQLNVNAWAKNNDIDNEDLLDFSNYSYDYYFEDSKNKTYEQLVATGNYSKQNAQLMADTMALLNVNYFGGTTNDLRKQLSKDAGFKLWQDSDLEFFTQYVMEMAEENQFDNNQIEIEL